MEDIATLWTFQESTDELKQKVDYMTFEVELIKKKANEERMKNDEQINKLLQLLQAAYKERDEARSQLEKLQQVMVFNKPSFDDFIPFSPDTPLFTNSSQSYVSSPSFSLDSTNDMNGLNPKVEMIEPAIDQGSLLIERLAKGRPLPEKGKFLEAVIEAGPLLQTLLVAGPLPQWRNPPGIVLSRQIPPVDVKGCGIGSSSMDVNHHPKSRVGFGTSSSGFCLMGGRFINTAVNFDSQFPKRQRIQ